MVFNQVNIKLFFFRNVMIISIKWFSFLFTQILMKIQAESSINRQQYKIKFRIFSHANITTRRTEHRFQCCRKLTYILNWIGNKFIWNAWMFFAHSSQRHQISKKLSALIIPNTHIYIYKHFSLSFITFIAHLHLENVLMWWNHHHSRLWAVVFVCDIKPLKNILIWNVKMCVEQHFKMRYESLQIGKLLICLKGKLCTIGPIIEKRLLFFCIFRRLLCYCASLNKMLPFIIKQYKLIHNILIEDVHSIPFRLSGPPR